MTITKMLETRVSTRAFLDTPVPEETLHAIFETAQRSPSNCNVQPWQVYLVSGDTRDALASDLTALLRSGAQPNPDFDWKMYYEGVHKQRQYAAAFALYDALGIDREDRPARDEAMVRNWSFFGAPHGVFFVMEKYLNIMGAVDLGIYAQTLALVLKEHGLASCMQGALGMYPGPVRRRLQIPESQGVLFGMSFGYADPDAAANSVRTDREAVDQSVIFAN